MYGLIYILSVWLQKLIKYTVKMFCDVIFFIFFFLFLVYNKIQPVTTRYH